MNQPQAFSASEELRAYWQARHDHEMRQEEVDPIPGVDYECYWCGDQGCTCWS